MNRVSNRRGAGEFTTEDEIWGGVDRSNQYLVSENDVPGDWRIRAIIGVYSAILGVGLIVLVF